MRVTVALTVTVTLTVTVALTVTAVAWQTLRGMVWKKDCYRPVLASENCPIFDMLLVSFLYF